MRAIFSLCIILLGGVHKWGEATREKRRRDYESVDILGVPET